MGAAIGFALAQPAGITFAVFTALALGLAAPYLLLSLQPAWTRLLPRPGAWMEILKQLTAVPLFATVIWLAWVYGQLYAAGRRRRPASRCCSPASCCSPSPDGPWANGPPRWSSAIAAVVLHRLPSASPSRSTSRKDTTPRRLAALLRSRRSTAPAPPAIPSSSTSPPPGASAARSTSAVLRSADVERQFADNNVTLLKADWTHYDPEITKQLASVGRSGVPTYVIYPAAPTPPPTSYPNSSPRTSSSTPCEET